MNKMIFIFCMMMGAGATACTQIGNDFNGNAIFDCAGVIVNTGGSQQRDPLSGLRKLRNDWDEQRKFNERMRRYESTKIKIKPIEPLIEAPVRKYR